MEALGGILKTAHTACTVVWPCTVPLLLHQYIRGRDRDFYALELLAYKAKTENVSDFYDKTKGPVGGHWRMRKDMETIFKGVNGAK